MIHDLLGNIFGNTRLVIYTIFSLIVKFDRKQIVTPQHDLNMIILFKWPWELELKRNTVSLLHILIVNKTATDHFNMVPVCQMFMLLCRYALANTLNMLSDYIGIRPSLLSIVERGVEKQIYLLKSVSFIPSRWRILIDYLQFLKNKSQGQKIQKTNLIRPNTCLYVDGSHTTNFFSNDFFDYEVNYSGKDRIHSFYHQALCDLNGLIFELLGPAEGVSSWQKSVT